jgi:hypothetical protein
VTGKKRTFCPPSFASREARLGGDGSVWDESRNNSSGSGKMPPQEEGDGMRQRLGRLLWRGWVLAKDFYEHHHFAVRCSVVVPAAIGAGWAWLANFNGLAIFIILVVVAALFAVIMFCGAVAYCLLHDTTHEPPASAIAQGYLTCREVIEYMAHESQWGADKDAEVTPDGMHKNVILEAPGEFRER